MKKKYSEKQLKFLNYIKEKVIKLFENYPEPAHGIDHIERVASWVNVLVQKEKVINPFLCELSAWLHDIGRTREDNPGESSRKHHELSYIILKEWYREDEKFNFLSDKEKIELLYAVRYHWNDMANKYDTAWILRDADKLDLFGEIGLNRALGGLKEKDKALNQHLRNAYNIAANFHTKTAQKIFKKQKMFKPLEKYYKKYLEEKIEEIKLHASS